MASYPTTSLQPGSTNTTAVKQLQDYLVSQGYMTKSQVSTGYGIYGPQTTAAVLAYQKDLGIDYSSGPGYWGPKTIAAVSSQTSTAPNQSTTSGPVYNPPTTTIKNAPNQSTVSGPVYNPPPTLSTTSKVTSSPTSSTGSYTQLDPSIVSKITSNLGPNMSSDPKQVAILQEALVKAGYMSATDLQNGGLGVYGPKTTAAVAKWQQITGVNVGSNPGYFGPASKAALSNYQSQSGINAGTPRVDSTGVDQTYAPPDGLIPDPLGKTTLGNQSADAFNTLVKELKPGTREYEKAMDKVSSMYYDVLQQQLNAQTQQEHDLAETNWQNLKSNIEKSLNISLSNDALQAWDQIESIRSEYGKNNLEGSGLQNESIDDYLRKTRLADESMRLQSQTQEEKNEMDYYTKFATPEQIRDLIASDPEKARSYGLIPSDDIKNSMTRSALRKKYPDMSDEQIDAAMASMFDEYGNYRSSLYQRQMVGSSVGANNPNITTTLDEYGVPKIVEVNPSDTGILDINLAREQNRMSQVDLQNTQAKAVAERSVAQPTTVAQVGATAATTFAAPTTTSRTTTTTPKTATTTPKTTTTTVPKTTTTTVPKTTTTTTTPTTTKTSTPLTTDQKNQLASAYMQLQRMSEQLKTLKK